jgi:hypothetical protein
MTAHKRNDSADAARIGWVEPDVVPFPWRRPRTAN